MSEPQPIAHCSECDRPIFHEWEWTLHEHPCIDDLEEPEGFEEEDQFDCGMGRDGLCGKAGSEECDFECPYRDAKRN